MSGDNSGIAVPQTVIDQLFGPNGPLNSNGELKSGYTDYSLAYGILNSYLQQNYPDGFSYPSSPLVPPYDGSQLEAV